MGEDRGGRLHRPSVIALSIACVVAVAVAACTESPVDMGPAGPAPGRIQILDRAPAEGETGWWPSVTFDSQDRPHLTYCDAYHGDLRYATRAAGAKTWTVTSIVTEGAVGKYTAVATDAADRVGVVFYDQDTKYLRYAWQEPTPTKGPNSKSPPNNTAGNNTAGNNTAGNNTAGKNAPGWRTENIAWGLEVGMGSELRFDAEGTPHLFYYVPSGSLIHAHRNKGGTWSKNVIAKATGGFSVRIDPVLTKRGFWLSYLDWNVRYTTVYVAHQDSKSGPWVIEKVDDRRSPGWRSQILRPTASGAQILYSGSLDNILKVATRTPEGWKKHLLMQNVGNFAARPTNSGDTIIAYEDIEHGAPGNGTMKYARGRDTSWQRFTVDLEGPSGQYLALALDSHDRPLIAYFASDIRGIKIYDETQR